MMKEYSVFEATELRPEVEFVRRKYVVYRTTSEDERFYFRMNGDEVEFFPSVTAIARAASQAAPYYVQKKISEIGLENWRKYMNEKALRGAFLHLLCAKFLRAGALNLESVESELAEFRVANNIDFSTASWIPFSQKAMLSFAQFCADAKLRPLAAEMALVSARGYAGAVDIAAEMETKNGREIAIIDVKSGELRPEHETQLYAYRELWNENFPEMRAERVYNWQPKDWRAEKKLYSYALTDQTERMTEAGAIWRAAQDIYALRGAKKPQGFYLFLGEIRLGEKPESLARRVTPEEAAKKYVEAKIASNEA